MTMTNLTTTMNDVEGVDMIKVLDKGYVRLDDHMGDDLAIANAARVSYAKRSNQLTKGDIGLINFLVREDHTSPFRHATVKFEFKAPLMVARQHWKYVVGSDHTMDGWNESSRRYVTADEEFYIPMANQWRSSPANSKQGSGEPVSEDVGASFTQLLLHTVDKQLDMYRTAMEAGICAEQARLFLPAYSLYVNYIWTASLQSVMHFLSQRLEHDAQKEIQEYAQAVHKLVQPLFPICFEALKL